MDGKWIFCDHIICPSFKHHGSNLCPPPLHLCSESDYAVLTRDFEEYVDDKVLEAVKNATAKNAAAAATKSANAEVGAASAITNPAVTSASK